MAMERVNALLRAFSISTESMKDGMSTEINVSMPYFGLSPFLRILKKTTNGYTVACQCPTSGFLHFYATVKVNLISEEPVSMPYFGLSPFLPLIFSKY